MTAPVAVAGVDVDGRPVRLLLRGDRIEAVGDDVEVHPGTEVIDAGDGVVLAGPHDHHVHLRSLAAARASVDVGPPLGASGFRQALRGAPDLGDGWIRAIGYHETVAGELDRRVLDAVEPDRPVRVQHRSGVRWVLNSRALELTGAATATSPGVLRDERGEPTGVVQRADGWLARRTPQMPLAWDAVGAEAAAAGWCGFTDADPRRSDADVAVLVGLRRDGHLPQRLHLMGPVELTASEVPEDAGVTIGAVKVLLDDHQLPSLAGLSGTIAASHERGRPVAIHVVSRVQAVLAIAAFDEAGTVVGDRLEHAAVLGADQLADVVRLGLAVVTQPGLVAERGDDYLAEVDPVDLPDLWRCRSLVDAGVPVSLGTDAPYGHPDPWEVVRAAATRTTRAGTVVGADEVVPVRRALAMLAGRGDAPATPRRFLPGEPADIVVLATTASELEAAVVEDRVAVAATIVAGHVVHAASAGYT